MLNTVKSDIAELKAFNFSSYYVDFIMSKIDDEVQQEVKSVNTTSFSDINHLISMLQERLAKDE